METAGRFVKWSTRNYKRRLTGKVEFTTSYFRLSMTRSAPAEFTTVSQHSLAYKFDCRTFLAYAARGVSCSRADRYRDPYRFTPVSELSSVSIKRRAKLGASLYV